METTTAKYPAGAFDFLCMREADTVFISKQMCITMQSHVDIWLIFATRC